MLFTLSWLIPALAASVLGESSGSSTFRSDPIIALRKKGISVGRLNAIALGLIDGDGCFCSLACDILASTIGADSVSLLGEETYASSRAKFWSQQQSHETKPKCFVRPADPEEVSITILLARATECPFAIKGSGHTSFKGASNSHGGITIDFVQMKHVVPSTDKKSVAIGPGNTWFDVYTTLETFNLTMAGGRTATVGVSGLTLGGGISFFSGQHGWTCDNIISYEIVLGSGEILTVDSKTDAALFWALRGGGGGNFGVVTQFVASTFEQGPMWGGFLAWEMHSSKTALVDAMVNYAEKGSLKDPKAALIVSFAYVQLYQMWVSSLVVDHLDPQPHGSHPEVFDEIFNVENAFQDTTRTASHSNLTVEVANASPPGLRQSYWTITTRLDKQFALDILTIFQEESNPILNLTSFLPSFIYQIIPVSQLKAMTRNGGNALGIGGGEEPLLLISLSPMWVLGSDDRTVLTWCSNIISRTEALARERGLEHPFIYINYASQFQDPLSSYGAENMARLMEVSRKYDPDGVFQKLSPGYFKFGGAPASWL
ncbi:FAD-binding domain-containing protein [Hypoxylon cercidicola]|nr:FAD-binding domain-containing protein [Hypoxylon cercidicola]